MFVTWRSSSSVGTGCSAVSGRTLLRDIPTQGVGLFRGAGSHLSGWRAELHRVRHELAFAGLFGVNDHAIANLEVGQFGGCLIFAERSLGDNRDGYQGIRRGLHGNGICAEAVYCADDVLLIAVVKGRYGNH